MLGRLDDHALYATRRGYRRAPSIFLGTRKINDDQSTEQGLSRQEKAPHELSCEASRSSRMYSGCSVETIVDLVEPGVSPGP